MDTANGTPQPQQVNNIVQGCRMIATGFLTISVDLAFTLLRETARVLAGITAPQMPEPLQKAVNAAAAAGKAFDEGMEQRVLLVQGQLPPNRRS